MKQLIIIGGGEVFDTKEDFHTFLRDFQFLPRSGTGSRKDRIIQAVSGTYKTLKPMMPASRGADYQAWKIWFERQVQENKKDTQEYILIGYSLGGSFLLRYLSENNFDGEIKQLHLVSSTIYTSGFGGFTLDQGLVDEIKKKCDHIYIYHSTDDSIVPYTHAEELAKLLPDAHLEKFETRGHFFQPAFPELLDNIGIYKTR